MDKDNRQAKNGLRKIADHYETLAKNKQRTGDLPAGLELVKLGLNVYPDHPGLIGLQEAIINALDSRRKTEPLFQAAQRKLEAGKFTKPPGDNALTIYQKILQIDPQNLRAKKGIQTIAEYYISQAQAKQQAGKLQQGLSIVQEGLIAIPGHPDLSSLEATISRQLEEKRKRKQPRQWYTM